MIKYGPQQGLRVSSTLLKKCKLHSYGVSRESCTQRVNEWNCLNVVPQESILSPLFFMIFLKGILNFVPKGALYLILSFFFFFFFYKTHWYLWLSSNILNSKQVNIDMGWIMKQHWYTPLLHWWPLCKRCACTLIRVSWRLSNLGWLLLYKCAKLYTVE